MVTLSMPSNAKEKKNFDWSGVIKAIIKVRHYSKRIDEDD